jgi:hypothetical protein
VYMCVRRMCVCVYGCVCGVVHILCASMVVCVMCVCVLTAPTLLRPRPPKLCQPPQFVSTLVPRCFPHTPLAPPPPYFLAVYSSEQSRPLFRPAVSASGMCAPLPLPPPEIEVWDLSTLSVNSLSPRP